MTRDKIIYELAAYAHPSWYHQLLSWSTAQLARLLDYYKNEDDYHALQIEIKSITPDALTVTISSECEFCDGTGEVACDEWDPDSGRYMAGVGSQRCICTYE